MNESSSKSDDELDGFMRIEQAIDGVTDELAKIKDVRKGGDASEAVNRLVAILQDQLAPLMKIQNKYVQDWASSAEEAINDLDERLSEVESPETTITTEDAEMLRDYVQTVKAILVEFEKNVADVQAKSVLNTVITRSDDLLGWIDSVESAGQEAEDEDEETEGDEVH